MMKTTAFSTLALLTATTAMGQLTRTELSDAIVGENGYSYIGMASVTESYVSSDIFNNNFGDGYKFVGVMDGLGAFEKDNDTIRVLMNHEVGSFPQINTTWTTGDGKLTLGGGRVSYVDINKISLEIVDSGIAINSFVDGEGNAIDSVLDFDNGSLYGDRDGNGFAPVVPGFGGIDRPCSAQFFSAGGFGNGSGFADNIYLFGEEQSSRFGGFGGQFWALDTDTGIAYEAPAMGRGAWESGTLIDTGSENTIAVLMGDDHGFSGSDASGSPAPSALLYVGQKNANGDFLDRNGLKNGTIYAWVPESGDARDLGNLAGNGTSLDGSWVALDNTGLAPDGTATDAELRQDALDKGAQIFSRPEDVHTDPTNGKVAVMANTGRFINEDGVSPDGADQEGSLHVFDFTNAFDNDGNLILGSDTTSVTNIYDADADNALDLGDNEGLDSPDNLVWSADGFIYVQEDGDPDAGIYKIADDGSSILRIARADVDLAEFDESSSTPESSGIIDVSDLFGLEAGSVFMADTQNHNIRGAQVETGYDPGEFAQLGFIVAPGVAFPIPEPSSLALLGLGGLLIARRRRG